MPEKKKNTSAENQSSWKAFYKKHESSFLYFFDILINGIVIIGLVYLIRYFLISPFQVSGSSMCNTLNFIEEQCISKYNSGGEYIIIDKTYRYRDPVRGDVVVFTPPSSTEDYYVKRLIGLPGEKVVIEDGLVRIFNEDYPNGFDLPEEYLNEDNKDNTSPEGEFDIPSGYYFVMGDNRMGSFDSRHWKDNDGNPTPFIRQSDIDGEVWFVLWPFGNMRFLEETKYKLPEPEEII